MNIIAPITRFSSRNALRIKKNSPQILFYAGIVGTVATTVLASRATLKAVPVVDQLRAERTELDQFSREGRVSEEDYSHAVAQQYTTAGVQLTKLYGPVVLVGVGSLVALTKSHQQLTTRNTALTMAYTGLFKTFDSYRERVRAQLGDEQDRKFLHGTVMQELEYEDKGGRARTKEIETLDPTSKTPYTYFYDKNCSSWMPDPGYNQNTLDGQQRWANVRLQRQGHLFLNEVYDLLGIPHTADGAVLGWIWEDLSDRGIQHDTFVKFNHDKDGEFTAGYKKDVMLEFNIHGPILEFL